MSNADLPSISMSLTRQNGTRTKQREMKSQNQSSSHNFMLKKVNG